MSTWTRTFRRATQPTYGSPFCRCTRRRRIARTTENGPNLSEFRVCEGVAHDESDLSRIYPLIQSWRDVPYEVAFSAAIQKMIKCHQRTCWISGFMCVQADPCEATGDPFSLGPRANASNSDY